MTLSNKEMMYGLDKYFISLKDLKKKKSVAPISPNKRVGVCDSDSAEESLSSKFKDLLKINTGLAENINKEIKARKSHLREEQTQLKNTVIREVANDLYRVIGRHVETEIDREKVINSFSSIIEKFYETLSSTKQGIKEQKREMTDVERSGSTWDYETFRRYAEDLLKRGCEFEFKIDRVSVRQNVNKIMINNIRERFEECGRVLSGDTKPARSSSIPRDILQPLKKFMMREESVRAFLNIMLFPIFDEAGVKVLLEEKLSVEGMPTNICDYILFNGSGEAIGVIEAKDGGKLNEKSVIQCLLQMLSLQKAKRSCTNLFGVVTDAYHFVFLSLRGKTLTFYCKENFECDISKNDSWEDMEDIIVTILGLCLFCRYRS